MTMFIWYNARKLNNRITRFLKIRDHQDLLVELSNDVNIPKFATHLIYLTKANRESEIEEKIIKSIFARKPKRADVYWFLHINRTEHPYTLDYSVTELIDDKLIKVTINVGFRVQPKAEQYFKQIVNDMVEKQELNLHIRPDGSTKYNNEPEFKFIVTEKYISIENEFTISESLLLNSYYFLRKISLRDEGAFGLEKSDVKIEQIPIIYHQCPPIKIVRRDQKKGV